MRDLFKDLLSSISCDDLKKLNQLAHNKMSNHSGDLNAVRSSLRLPGRKIEYVKSNPEWSAYFLSPFMVNQSEHGNNYPRGIPLLPLLFQENGTDDEYDDCDNILPCRCSDYCMALYVRADGVKKIGNWVRPRDCTKPKKCSFADFLARYSTAGGAVNLDHMYQEETESDMYRFCTALRAIRAMKASG